MSTPARPFLTANWHHLAMLNYEIDPTLLAPHVPAGTELDSWDGRTFVSMVGFRFLGTRVLGVPIPFHRNFDEINLRFYVRRVVDDEVRRGVVFVKEIVPRRAIAWVARAVYGENYLALPMSSEVEVPDADRGVGRATYSWRTRERWNRIAVKFDGQPALPTPGSEEEFITEHYWGYARQRSGATIEYRVEHPQWRVWRAVSAALDCDVATFYGDEFVDALRGSPASAFIADGSAVTVRHGMPLG
jgi:uncharacterized protein YqjF (DUF2071 family)